MCGDYQDATIRNVRCRRLQVDEIWSFVYAKDRNIPADIRESSPFTVGSAWTWMAIDSDTKLMVSWLVGQRDERCALLFMRDIASRLVGRFQMTTDGLKLYYTATEEVFGGEIDYAMLTKLYGKKSSDASPETRYSPSEIKEVRKDIISGNPDPAHISTSYIERANLTLRMGQRRFTRLTNAFSKKFENHAHAVNLHMMFYNFIRIHQTTRMTPAQAAGLSDRAWTMADVVELIESRECEAVQAVTAN